MSKYPPYLAAINKKDNSVFVLAAPDLSAILIDGVWHRSEPLSDEKIMEFDLVTDLAQAQKYVNSARRFFQSK